MNKYRIRYKQGARGIRIVTADTIHGFQPSCDTYIFKMEGEIVAVIPKANVISIETIATGDDD